MQRLFAILWLTWKAAFRFRLFWVLAVLLMSSVVLLPLLVKHDGTARGFTQILLTYTLGVTAALLGLATLWLACGTLARDIEECQMQVVAVKPIRRWQIWLGKWLGLVSLNAVLLALAGAAVFGLLQWRSLRLPPDQQAILRQEVLVARGSLREPGPDFQPLVEKIFQQRRQNAGLSPADQRELRKQIEEQVKAQYQLVPPGFMRQWTLETGGLRAALGAQPLFLRVKFYAAKPSASGTFLGLWRFGNPESPRLQEMEKSMAAETFHEFAVSADAIDAQGRLVVNFLNRNDTALLFPLDEGFEVLYRQGGFGPNFVRGLAIMLCWLALLAALGLAASSFLSFPVAAFFSMAMLLLVFASGTITSVVEEGTVLGLNHETGQAEHTTLDALLLPSFKVLLKVINLAQAFSPVDALSTGRNIAWSQLGLAFVQIVLVLGGALALVGIVTFNRRELATAHE